MKNIKKNTTIKPQKQRYMIGVTEALLYNAFEYLFFFEKGGFFYLQHNSYYVVAVTTRFVN